MARPSRNNADYFTHNADFRNDRRIKAIRGRFGPAGYGLVLMLLEVLSDADHTQLSTEELEMELLAGDFGVSVTEINSLLQLAEKIGFFTRNEANFLICPDLNKALEPVFDKRNRSRNNAQQSKMSQPETAMPVSVTVTTQSKVKESKEEINKEGKSYSFQSVIKTTYWSVLKISFSAYQDWLIAQAKKVYVTFPDNWTMSMVDLYKTDWLGYRQSKRGRLQPKSIQTQINELASLSALQLKACINNSISNGYQGLFSDKYAKPCQSPPVRQAPNTPTSNRPFRELT